MNVPSHPDPMPRALHRWRVSPPADPGFRGAVWARIEAARCVVVESWSGYCRRHMVAWSLVLLTMLAGAAWHGQRAGASHTRAEHDTIMHSYLAQIDARAMLH